MADEVVLTFTMRYDRAKADKYNDSLFGGEEEDDPVVGDGKVLVVETVKDWFRQGDCGSMPVDDAFLGATMQIDGGEPEQIEVSRGY